MRSPCTTIVPLAASTTDIASASGSMARTYTPTEVLCMPRKAKGSLCVPAATASTSGLRRCGIPLPAHLCQHAQDAGERDRHPFRPVGELVRHLVDGFFEGEEIDQRPRLQLARRIGGTPAHRLAVGCAETIHRALPPCIGEYGQTRRRRGARFVDLPY